MSKKKWGNIYCSISELNLDLTLASGQTFRWRKTTSGQWHGVLDTTVVALKQLKDAGIIKYKELGKLSSTFVPEHTSKCKRRKFHIEEFGNETETAEQCHYGDADLKKRLHDFFQLDVNLSSLYACWSQKDENFRTVGSRFPGIRILRQDPVETVVAFISSSNNNIARITRLVDKLCEKYGLLIMETEDHKFTTFPTFEALAGEEVESTLRKLGFGYRAKYISETARTIAQNRPHGWLESLKMMTYEDARNDLLHLQGIGAKVADCICLMALDKSEAVPVDTHMWQIASQCYIPELSSAKTLNKKLYNEIGNFFRTLFGEYAGWAQSVLFYGHLQLQRKSNEIGTVR